MITGLTPTTCMLKNLVTLSIYCIWRQSLIDHDKLINKSEKVSDSDTETWVETSGAWGTWGYRVISITISWNDNRNIWVFPSGSSIYFH